MVFYNFNTCPADKEHLLTENEERKKQREEEEVRVRALESEFEDRLSRRERELSRLEKREQRDEVAWPCTSSEGTGEDLYVCFFTISHS